jgi:hypothetical protein
MESKGINKMGAIITSLTPCLIYCNNSLFTFLQISEFSSAWELFREKLLEALNQISVFIAERFETTTEEQVAF